MLRNSKDIGQTKVTLPRIYPGDFQCSDAILHDSKTLKLSKHAANACFSAEIPYVLHDIQILDLTKRRANGKGGYPQKVKELLAESAMRPTY